MHKSSVRFRFGSVKKIGGSVRFGFGKKFLVRSFTSEDLFTVFEEKFFPPSDYISYIVLHIMKYNCESQPPAISFLPKVWPSYTSLIHHLSNHPEVIISLK